MISSNVFDVVRTAKSARRSGCPVNVALEVFGDTWSLLIVRDLMVRGYRTFKEFHEAGEGISTNILADRLQRLETAGIIGSEQVENDGGESIIGLRRKGLTWGLRCWSC